MNLPSHYFTQDQVREYVHQAENISEINNKIKKVVIFIQKFLPNSDRN